MARSIVSSFFLILALGCASGGGAGVDAGGRDASSSTPDTGTNPPDGGGADSDVAPPDAEPAPDTGVEEDAGSDDAGATEDAGGTDAGGTDAGGTDAGGTDAGGTDAGRTDAGPSCPGGCDDGVACTVDVCTAGGCTNTPDDSLCVSPQTCNATLGCRDAMCAETPCRLVGPQCGCPSGQGCYLTTMDTRVCAPAGTATEGQSCASANCAPGLICIDVSETATEVPVCKRFCNSDTDCTGGPGSRCIATVGSAGTQVCSSNCDVITQTGCPGDAYCSIYTTMSGTRLTDCGGPLGTGGQNASCVDDSNCQRGFSCINTGAGGNRCLLWCRRSAPTTSCPVGTACVRLGDAPGLVYNGAEYGVCF